MNLKFLNNKDKLTNQKRKNSIKVITQEHTPPRFDFLISFLFLLLLPNFLKKKKTQLI